MAYRSVSWRSSAQLASWVLSRRAAQGSVRVTEGSVGSVTSCSESARRIRCRAEEKDQERAANRKRPDLLQSEWDGLIDESVELLREDPLSITSDVSCEPDGLEATCTLSVRGYARPGLSEDGQPGPETMRVEELGLELTHHYHVGPEALAELQTPRDFALGGLTPSQLEPGRYGLLSSSDIEANLDTEVAWILDTNGKLSTIPLGGGEPTSLSLTGVQYPYTLEMSSVSASKVVATVSSEDAPTRAFALGVDPKGMLDGSAIELDAPSGGFALDGSNWIIEDDVIIQLGRWPWNWRDKFQQSLDGEDPWFEPVPVLTSWDLKQANAEKAAPVTSVRPAVAADASQAVGARDGERVLTSVTADGMLELKRLKVLTAECADPKACALPITEPTPGGLQLNVLPGQTGLTWAVSKYGDILIDGVPLVFDLVDPPILGDTPGAGSGSGALIAHEAGHYLFMTVDEQGKLSLPSISMVEASRPLDFGDFNGDGFEDLAVSPPNEPGHIWFGDGLGGYLPEPMALPGGPTIVWPSVVRGVAGNGSGTRKAAAQAQQNNLALL